MDEAWQQRVRERAYAIWQREGNPDGAPEQYWLMAEEELLAEGQGPSHPPSPSRPISRPTRHRLPTIRVEVGGARRRLCPAKPRAVGSQRVFPS